MRESERAIEKQVDVRNRKYNEHPLMWKKRRNGMDLVKIKGVQKNKPAREESKNMLTMADIIEGRSKKLDCPLDDI